MPVTPVDRPVWRRFDSRFYDRAVAWVRAGGSAAVVLPRGNARGTSAPRVDMLLATDDQGAITEAAYWSLLSVEQRRWVRVPRGSGKGLALARVQPHALEAVLDWCERDSIHPGPTRRLRIDCLDCGSCCHEANVILYPEDIDRFRDAGREELAGSRYVRRRNGKLTLRFAVDGRCQHLRRDLKCRIYEIRPFNCSVFPVGSEACLAARETTRGWRDGAPASDGP
jgi:hypothetical protein